MRPCARPPLPFLGPSPSMRAQKAWKVAAGTRQNEDARRPCARGPLPAVRFWRWLGVNGRLRAARGQPRPSKRRLPREGFEAWSWASWGLSFLILVIARVFNKRPFHRLSLANRLCLANNRLTTASLARAFSAPAPASARTAVSVAQRRPGQAWSCRQPRRPIRADLVFREKKRNRKIPQPTRPCRTSRPLPPRQPATR